MKITDTASSKNVIEKRFFSIAYEMSVNVLNIEFVKLLKMSFSLT